MYFKSTTQGEQNMILLKTEESQTEESQSTQNQMLLPQGQTYYGRTIAVEEIFKSLIYSVHAKMFSKHEKIPYERKKHTNEIFGIWLLAKTYIFLVSNSIVPDN